MTAERKRLLNWLWSFILTRVDAGFFGTIKITMENGKILRVQAEESHKPPRA